MAKVGRPTAYKPEYAEQAYKLCLLGHTDKEMAAFFGVSEQTLNAWKSSHSEFLESLTNGKDLADANVARSLYQRAVGYSHPAVKIMQVAGKIEEVAYTEHYPPDTPAATLWLKNRQPTRWRDKVEQHHSGTIGITDLTDEQLEARLKQLEDANARTED